LGLLDSFFANRKQKKDERDALCRSAIDDVVAATQGIENLLHDTPGYIYEYDYASTLASWLQLESRLAGQNRKLRKSSSHRELQRQSGLFQTALSNLNSSISAHNSLWLKNAITEAYRLIGNIEGRPLDHQQMGCIVKDAPNHLVVAGAGTGKTTTILGKVKYLLATEACKPDEILVLSFTNAAASEMNARLVKETNLDIRVSTFHKLGLDIIRKAEGKAPLIYKGDSRRFIREQIDNCLEDDEYARLLMVYMLFHRVNQKSEFDFDSERSYKEYLTTNPPTTIKGETVKSYGEMEIANFLTQYGIAYQYEASYKVDTRTEEFGQYYPDFYLPQYDIYIEYFGTNSKGEVPSYFSGRDGKTATEVYQEGIAWKESIHQANSTALIECFAYEKLNGSLLDNLRKALQKHGVSMEQVSVNELFSQMDTGKKNVLDGLAELFQTVLSLSKSNRLTSQGLMDLCAAPSFVGQKVLVRLFNPIFDAYEKMLLRGNGLPFHTVWANKGEARPSYSR
jgi:DNA helicase-4